MPSSRAHAWSRPPVHVEPEAEARTWPAQAPPIPKYYQLRAELERQIAAGQLAPGAFLPPERLLLRQYGVSRTTLREALTFSRNVVTVKVATRIGIKPLVTYVKHLGIRSPLAPNLSLALGSSEVNLLELAAVYSVFANQGQRVEPRFITRITDSAYSIGRPLLSAHTRLITRTGAPGRRPSSLASRVLARRANISSCARAM